MLNRAQSPVPIYWGLLWGQTHSLSLWLPPSPLAAFSRADKCAWCLPWRTAMRIKSGGGEKGESSLIKCNIMTPKCTARWLSYRHRPHCACVRRTRCPARIRLSVGQRCHHQISPARCDHWLKMWDWARGVVLLSQTSRLIEWSNSVWTCESLSWKKERNGRIMLRVLLCLEWKRGRWWSTLWH